MESLPLHEDIKLGRARRSTSISTPTGSRCATSLPVAITTICYNFMPILDWTRTDLAYPIPVAGAPCASMR